MKRLHPKSVWLFFIESITTFIVIILVIIFILWLMTAMPLSGKNEAAGDVGAFFLNPIIKFANPMNMMIFLVVTLIIAYIASRLTYHFYRYELSDQGLRKESGIISKRYTIVTFDRIQNINISRSLIARILGLSTLKVDTAGTTNAEFILPGLADQDARQLKEEIMLQMKANQNKDQGL